MEKTGLARRVLAVLLLLAASSPRALDDIDAARLMQELVWEKRVLLVFASDQQDAGFQRQDAILGASKAGLIERDMAVIRVFSNNRLSVDGQGYAQSTAGFLRHFTVDPGEFRVILVGKDGGVKLDRNDSVSVAELFALIDSMPMRRHEMSQDG